jgi:hypothetical protein
MAVMFIRNVAIVIGERVVVPEQLLQPSSVTIGVMPLQKTDE